MFLIIFAEFHGAEARSSAEALGDCISSNVIKNRRFDFALYNAGRNSLTFVSKHLYSFVQVGTAKKKRMQLLVTADCVRVVDEQTKVRRDAFVFL